MKKKTKLYCELQHKTYPRLKVYVIIDTYNDDVISVTKNLSKKDKNFIINNDVYKVEEVELEDNIDYLMKDLRKVIKNW